MKFFILKYLISAGVIAVSSELAKKSDKVGSLVASLPLVTLLVLFWLYFDGESNNKIGQHAYYTFWYVIPTLPMFLLFPFFLKAYGFWCAIGASVLITICCFFSMFFLLKRFEIDLI